MNAARGTREITREVAASPAAVWAVLSDGWLYPSWVVGASRMRAVDPHWPQVGAQLHHSVGTWPLLVDDRTEVVDVVPERLLRLKARAWPTGTADVIIEVEQSARGSRVRILEDVVAGPGSLVPKALRQLAIGPRNQEALQRLAFVAEGMA